MMAHNSHPFDHREVNVNDSLLSRLVGSISREIKDDAFTRAFQGIYPRHGNFLFLVLHDFNSRSGNIYPRNYYNYYYYFFFLEKKRRRNGDEFEILRGIL